MKHIRGINLNLMAFILVTILEGCSKSYDIDSDGNPEAQAIEITQKRSPKDAAKDVVRWMSEAKIEDREFARSLTKAIFSYYDSKDSDSGREFLYALDSIKEFLPDKKLARVYIVATTPWRLGVILRENDVSETLVDAVIKEYGSDSVSFDYFIKSYYPER